MGSTSLWTAPMMLLSSILHSQRRIRQIDTTAEGAS